MKLKEVLVAARGGKPQGVIAQRYNGGVSTAYISAIEAGRAKPPRTVAALRGLCDAYGANYGDVLTAAIMDRGGCYVGLPDDAQGVDAGKRARVLGLFCTLLDGLSDTDADRLISQFFDLLGGSADNAGGVDYMEGF